MDILVPERPLLHVTEALVDALRWGFPAGMDAHWNAQLLSLRPEGVIIGVSMRLVGWGKGHKKGALAATLDCALQLTSGLLGIAEGDMGNGNKTASGSGAKIHAPAVIRAGVGGLQPQIIHILGFPGQPHGRIDNRFF